MCDHEDNELPVSDLGRKGYWDSLYARDTNTLTHDGVKPVGWFGSQVVEKMIRCFPDKFNSNHRILDVGCGNGEVMIRLVDFGWTLVTGFDYSEEAIKLAQLMFVQSKKEKSARTIDQLQLKVVDLVNMSPEDFVEKYDIILDKGTYDAICMNPDVKDQSAVRDQYMENIHKLLEDGGKFVIASCNWTSPELEAHASKWFHREQTVPNSTFTFGGVSGDTTTICGFRKK